MDSQELPLCPVCNEHKDKSQYHINNYKKGNRAWMCKSCIRKYQLSRATNPKQRYSTALAKARHSNKEFLLSFPEYLLLIAKPCSYCEQPLESTGVGLDRQDNSRGYVTDNVVPCCWICNRTRADYFTPEEMRSEIGPIIKHVKLKRNTKTAVSGTGS